MATTTLTCNPQKITVPANTSDHDINFDDVLNLPGGECTILIDGITGTIKFNERGAVDDTNSASYTTGDKALIPALKGRTLHYKGSAGSETFNITVVGK